MLSQKARYALHALFLLAKRPAGEPVMIAEIAREAKVPRKFLEQILLELKKRGILHSVRGRQGGYTLGRAPDKISFAEIIRVIDGPLALSPCVSVSLSPLRRLHRRGDLRAAQGAARGARCDRGHIGDAHTRRHAHRGRASAEAAPRARCGCGG